MKKIILTTTAFVILSATTILGQTTKSQLSFCSATKDGDTISYTDLNACELISLDKKLKVKSYVIALFVPGKKGKEDGVYVDYTVEGSKPSQQVLNVLKNGGNGTKKILIEQVILLDGTTEIKSPGLIVIVQ